MEAVFRCYLLDRASINFGSLWVVTLCPVRRLSLLQSGRTLQFRVLEELGLTVSPNRGPRAELVLVSQDREYGRVERWQSELGKLGS